jgi:fido (protein-threonine AMPylation protein)
MGQIRNRQRLRGVFAKTLALDGLLEQARRKISGFEWTLLSLPAKADEPITFYGRLAKQHPFRAENTAHR